MSTPDFQAAFVKDDSMELCNLITSNKCLALTWAFENEYHEITKGILEDMELCTLFNHKYCASKEENAKADAFNSVQADPEISKVKPSILLEALAFVVMVWAAIFFLVCFGAVSGYFVTYNNSIVMSDSAIINKLKSEYNIIVPTNFSRINDLYLGLGGNKKSKAIALYAAIQSQNWHIVNIIMLNAIDIFNDSTFRIAISTGNIDIIKLFFEEPYIKSEYISQVVLRLIRENDIDKVTLLLTIPNFSKCKNSDTFMREARDHRNFDIAGLFMVRSFPLGPWKD